MSVSKQILEKINARIVKSLKEGKKPWRKQWQPVNFDDMSLTSPVNLVSKTRYQGLNRMILGTHRSSIPVFMTFEQVKRLKGSIKKGAESLPVLYFSKAKKVQADEDGNLTEKTVVFLKYYNVFNIEDTTLSLEQLTKALPEPTSCEPIEKIESVIHEYIERENIPVLNSLKENFYRPLADEIYMVDINHFKSVEAYYSVFLHEIVHSTGHPKRLDRLKILSNKKEYAFEELIAETAACYLTSHLNISSDCLLDNSGAYIRSWLTALENNPYFFYQAAKHAEIAANYILKAA